MSGFARFVAIGLTALGLAACGEAPRTPVPSPPPQAAIAPPTLPGPAAPGQARVYVYRDFGVFMHPAWTAVWLNDAKVGDSAPGTYFYRDVPPGTYTVSVNSDLPFVDQTRTITVAPNSTNYVKVYVVEGFGLSSIVGVSRRGSSGTMGNVPNVFGNIVVDAATARRQMARLRPMG